MRCDSTGSIKIMLKIYKKRKLRKNLRDGVARFLLGSKLCGSRDSPHRYQDCPAPHGSLKRRVCQAENTMKQANCQTKTHSGRRMIYRIYLYHFGRDGGFICGSKKDVSTDSLSPLEPRCCRLRCTCQSL